MLFGEGDAVLEVKEEFDGDAGGDTNRVLVATNSVTVRAVTVLSRGPWSLSKAVNERTESSWELTLVGVRESAAVGILWAGLEV